MCRMGRNGEGRQTSINDKLLIRCQWSQKDDAVATRSSDWIAYSRNYQYWHSRQRLYLHDLFQKSRGLNPCRNCLRRCLWIPCQDKAAHFLPQSLRFGRQNDPSDIFKLSYCWRWRWPSIFTQFKWKRYRCRNKNLILRSHSWPNIKPRRHSKLSCNGKGLLVPPEKPGLLTNASL